MKEIKYYNHTEGMYLTTHYCMDTDVKELIDNWKEQVFNNCREVNADHYIYCTVTYDSNDNIVEVNLYATPLDNKQFYKRVDAAEAIAKNNCTSLYFGVWHKGTAY